VTFDYAMRNFTIDHFPVWCTMVPWLSHWLEGPDRSSKSRLRRPRRALSAHDGQRDTAGSLRHSLNGLTTFECTAHVSSQALQFSRALPPAIGPSGTQIARRKRSESGQTAARSVKILGDHAHSSPPRTSRQNGGWRLPNRSAERHVGSGRFDTPP
jgi:hypothetical protein